MPAAQDLLRTIYTAFNDRDIEVVLAALQPDVDWPNGMEGGRIHGREQVRSYWLRQWSMLDPRVEPVRMEPEEAGRIVVDVHQVVRDLDGTLRADQMVQHVYCIEDGLITRMDIQTP